MTSYEPHHFPRFPLLPPELRIMIWRAALDLESRNQYVDVYLCIGPTTALWPQPDISSSIIRACRESRALANEFYPDVIAVYPLKMNETDRETRRTFYYELHKLSSKEKGCIRVNLKRITLVAKETLPRTGLNRRTRTRELSEEHHKLIQKVLSISGQSSLNRMHIMSDIYRWRAKCPNLQSYQEIQISGAYEAACNLTLQIAEEYFLSTVDQKDTTQIHQYLEGEPWTWETKYFCGGHMVTLTKSILEL